MLVRALQGLFLTLGDVVAKTTMDSQGESMGSLVHALVGIAFVGVFVAGGMVIRAEPAQRVVAGVVLAVVVGVLLMVAANV